MTSFEEYCPLCEGGLLTSGGLLADGGPLDGGPLDGGRLDGGYACARADSLPQGTRARTKRVVRIMVCIARSIRKRAVQRSPTKLCGFNICSRTNRAHPGSNSLDYDLDARQCAFDFTLPPLNLGLEECSQLPKFGREYFKSVDRI